MLVHIAARENPIVNRLNKTKIEREVDHEAEKAERLREEAAGRRQEAAAKVSTLPHPLPPLLTKLQRKAELELAKKREEEKKSRSYDHAWAAAEPSTSKSGGADEDEDFWGENATTNNADDSRMKEFEDFI